MDMRTTNTSTGQTVLWSAVRRAATESCMLRLDAGAYCNSSRQWDLTMANQGALSPLAAFARVHQPTIFGKRGMSGTAMKGIPVYSSSEMLMVNPEPTFFLSRRFERRIVDSLAIKSGWILVSRSGSIGYTLWVTEDRSEWVVDDHMIRVIPNDPKHGAYLYTYLSGPIGQAAIQSLAYGAVQLEINGTQLALMRVPAPGGSLLDAIARKVTEASANRTSANVILAAAILDMNRITGLPSLTHSGSNGLNAPHVTQCFSISASQINEGGSTQSECRLDAHFYNPSARLAAANVKKCRSEVKTIAELAERVLMGPRFKRNYVEATHGVPFLSGKNIVQIRPTDVKHLSNLQMADMQELVVKRGWTLITCSGTIGRTCFVWNNYEDYAASQHILRVIPDESRIDPGYLYAFLSSQHGYEQILRYRHGSVIDEVTNTQIEQVLVPRPSRNDQAAIGDKVREAYEKRAEAIRLENEAQAILMKELTKVPGNKGA